MPQQNAVRSILAASDLSPESDGVIRAAATFADLIGAQLHLVHALDLDAVAARAGAAGTATFPERLEQAERALNDQIARAGGAGAVRPTGTVVNLPAHQAITDRAAAVSAGLIVVGRSHREGVGARVLGTTANHLVSSRLPCLVVPGPLDRRLGAVVVPHDFSQPAGAALDLALRLLRQVQQATAPRLALVHVGWPVTKADNPNVEQEILVPDLRRQLEDSVRRTAVTPGIPVGARVVWMSNPADAIVVESQQPDVGLVVIGTHGRGGLKRALMGSVATEVASRAHCPVLLVPPP